MALTEEERQHVGLAAASCRILMVMGDYMIDLPPKQDKVFTY